MAPRQAPRDHLVQHHSCQLLLAEALISQTSSQTQLSRPLGSPGPSTGHQAPCPPTSPCPTNSHMQAPCFAERASPKGLPWHMEQRQSHWGWPQGPLEVAGGHRILPTRAANSGRAAEHEKPVGSLFSRDKRKWQCFRGCRSASLLPRPLI